MGTPAVRNPQSVTTRIDASYIEPRTEVTPSVGAYLSYTPPNREVLHSFDPLFTHQIYVPSRSKPVAIVPVRNRTGSTSYRVTGTIRGKQRKRIFLEEEDAKACQEQWEQERIHGVAATRPKLTSLTMHQLRESEAAFEFLKGTSMGLLDAVRYIIKNPPFKAPEVTWEDGLNAYLKDREKHLSKAHLATCGERARNFGKFIGKETLVTNITSANITDWLESKKGNCRSFSLKSWNNYRVTGPHLLSHPE